MATGGDNQGDGAPGSGLAVIAVPDFLPSLGGTTTQAANYARAIEETGRATLILTRRVDPSWPVHEVIDGLPVERIGPTGRGAVPEKRSVAAMARWFLRHRRHVTSVDVIMYPDFAVAAVLAGLASRTAMVWAGLGDATDTVGRTGTGPRRLLQGARRLAVSRVGHVALTRVMADELAAAGLQATVAPSPVDVRRFRPPSSDERAAARAALGVADDELVVIYVGQLRRLKAVGNLIAAFASLREGGVRARLELVGGSRGADDDEEEALRALALPLGDAVRFTGMIDDVVGHLWASDVFVLPSSREGMPNSLVEAMACGLPCIAPPSAGGDQVLTPDTGIVPPTNSPDDLLAALVPLADDAEGRRRMGKAAAEAGQWRPEQVVAILDEVHARHRSGRS